MLTPLVTLYAQVDSAKVAELERRIEILAEELDRLRSGEETVELTEEEARLMGLSPSAAPTYGQQSGASFAGYGEMLYENYAGSDQSGNPANKTTQFDYLRVTVYLSYRFNERWLFNSEIEMGHANESFVEFAYLDWRAFDRMGFRTGMLLMSSTTANPSATKSRCSARSVPSPARPSPAER